MDVAVKICTIVLLAVIVLSTLVFSIGLGDRPADAFYRTISLMATGADMGGGNLEAGGWHNNAEVVNTSGGRIFVMSKGHTWAALGSTTGGLWVSETQGDSWDCVSHTLPPIYAVRFG